MTRIMPPPPPPPLPPADTLSPESRLAGGKPGLIAVADGGDGPQLLFDRPELASPPPATAAFEPGKGIWLTADGEASLRLVSPDDGRLLMEHPTPGAVQSPLTVVSSSGSGANGTALLFVAGEHVVASVAVPGQATRQTLWREPLPQGASGSNASQVLLAIRAIGLSNVVVATTAEGVFAFAGPPR